MASQASKPTVTVLDYGAGNVRSVINALELLGCDVDLVRTAKDVRAAEILVFPGVGCFAAAMDALSGSNQGRSPLYRILHLLFVDNEASEVRKLIETERWKLLSQVNVDEHTRESEFGKNFWVLEGDPKISEFEANIAHAISAPSLMIRVVIE